MKKKYDKRNALLLLVILIGYALTTFAQIPTITNFSPISAKPNEVIRLKGTNSKASPANNNILFFGDTLASATSVTVIVPSEPTYAPKIILDSPNSLAATGVRNLTPNYSAIKSTLTHTNFQAKQDFTSGLFPISVAVGDLDGDGKPDLAVANFTSNTVSVYRSTASSGSIGSASFATKVDFSTGLAPTSVAISDLDKDGKPDLVVANSSSNTVSVYRNTATSGSIGSGSFATKVDFTTGLAPFSVGIADLNGDGKPDLAVANANSNMVSIIRNTAGSGSIGSGSFATKVDFTTGSTPSSVTLGDLDGDGKPELVIANLNSNTVSVFRNTSINGSSVSFAPKADFTTGSAPYAVAMGDLDGDKKPELVVANLNSNTVSVIRNNVSTGSIGIGSFAAKVDFSTGSNPTSVTLGDLDGDGKPDLATANLNPNTVSVIRNTSINGSINIDSFAAKVDFTTGTQPCSVALGDLDGDGRPDLALANYSSNTVSVIRNADMIVTSIKNGFWNDPNTWNVNRIPLSSEFVIIDQNHTVEITNTVNAKAIEYRNNSKLSFTNALSKLNVGL